jgi:transgelin
VSSALARCWAFYSQFASAAIIHTVLLLPPQEWIEEMTGLHFSGTFAESLKDGVILCKLANKIRPGSVPKINEPATMPFKKMENIANYLKAVRAIGMKEFEMFGTP